MLTEIGSSFADGLRSPPSGKAVVDMGHILSALWLYQSRPELFSTTDEALSEVLRNHHFATGQAVELVLAAVEILT
jgi:hypothetical protein